MDCGAGVGRTVCGVNKSEAGLLCAGVSGGDLVLVFLPCNLCDLSGREGLHCPGKAGKRFLSLRSVLICS